MDLLALLLLPLASCQLVETLHHGSIFGWLRDAGAWAKEHRAASWVLPLSSVHCPFCLSHWTAAVCVGLVFCGTPGFWVLAWLATVRASNLINDVFKKHCRTPYSRRPQEILEEVSTEHLEEEFIRRTAHPFGVPIGAVPQSGSPPAQGPSSP